jgi:hypothetical protein
MSDKTHTVKRSQCLSITSPHGGALKLPLTRVVDFRPHPDKRGIFRRFVAIVERLCQISHFFSLIHGEATRNSTKMKISRAATGIFCCADSRNNGLKLCDERLRRQHQMA